LAVGLMRLQVHSVLRTLSSVLCLLKVGLTVLGRPGSAFGNEVRHIIAARDEARGELTC
jgi:hypothetical protein